MTTPFNIHPDFQNVRAVKLSLNPLFLALMNGVLHLAAARKWAKYKTIATPHKVTGVDGHKVPVWLIKPAHITAPAPALVYCHGGAFILKHSPQHIETAVRYAEEANCCVLFVDYRLAPTHPFPAAFNDCYAVLTWATQNATALGIDKQRIAIGGDSAGAAIATGIVQKITAENTLSVCGQLLVYPVTDSDCKTASSTAYADVAPFKKLVMRDKWNAYLGRAAAAAVPLYAAPLHGNLQGLAPAYVETAEYDPLCDEGKLYANALISAGTNVIFNETKSTVHGYDTVAPDSELSRQAMKTRVQFLRNIFNS